LLQGTRQGKREFRSKERKTKKEKRNENETNKEEGWHKRDAFMGGQASL
jgi:hypothetical protein